MIGTDSIYAIRCVSSYGFKSNKKIYLIVPYNEKESIKKFRGLWDTKKKWFVYDNNENTNEIENIFSKEHIKLFGFLAIFIIFN